MALFDGPVESVDTGRVVVWEILAEWKLVWSVVGSAALPNRYVCCDCSVVLVRCRR